MKKLFVELLNQRCITYALRIVGGRTPPLNPSLGRVMVFNATFNYISVISWRSVLLWK